MTLYFTDSTGDKRVIKENVETDVAALVAIEAHAKNHFTFPKGPIRFIREGDNSTTRHFTSVATGKSTGYSLEP